MKQFFGSRPLSAAVLAALALALALWAPASVSGKSEKIPSLSAVGPFEAAEVLSGRTRQEVHAAWGEPDGMLSGFFGDVYVQETGASIVVYYDAEPMNEGTADAYTVPVQYAVYSEA